VTTHKKIKYLKITPENVKLNPKRNAYFWYELECQYCGETFKSTRIHKLYCSGRCKVAAHRAKAAQTD
jgi:hypothetical protein